jgi:hypothetical protein
MPERVRCEFAGIKFTGFNYGSSITVPTPAFRKILQSGKVRARCRYSYTDDYAWDMANDYGRRHSVSPARMLREVSSGRRPYLLYLEVEKNEIHYGTHCNECYVITEIDKAS